MCSFFCISFGYELLTYRYELLTFGYELLTFHLFTFGQKQCLCLTYSVLQCFEKLTSKRNKKHNFNRSYFKTETNLESRLSFQEVHLIFFKTTLFSVRSTHVGSRQHVPPPTDPGLAASGSRGSKG